MHTLFLNQCNKDRRCGVCAYVQLAIDRPVFDEINEQINETCANFFFVYILVALSSW
jgi:hypothetical protein